MRRRAALALGAATLGAVVSPSTVRARATPTRTASKPSYDPLGTLAVPGAREAVVSEGGETAYLATMDGFAAVDVSDPASPQLLAERRGLLSDRENGPLRGIQDVSVDGDRLLVVGPAHGGPDLRAALVYDVGEPAAPERVAVHETAYPIHNASIHGQYAYLTGNDGEGNPLVVVDVTGPEVASEWSIVDYNDAWREVPPALRVIHDVRVGDGVAALAYWDAGTVLLDVSDPAAPAPLARIGERGPEELAAVASVNAEAGALPGNHHYAALDPAGEVLAIGHEAWSTDPQRAPGGIDIWDVSTPTAPSRLARIPPPPTPDPSFRGTWTTAHNFDLHGGRLYSSWYQGGVKIHDLSDPGDPVEMAWWRRPSETRFWTAQHAGDFFVASSMAFRGTRSALYTFPDRAGTQPDPPSLTPSPSPASSPSPSPSPSRSPTDAATPTPVPRPVTGTTDREPGDRGADSPTDSPTGSPTPSTPADRSPTDPRPSTDSPVATGGQSGFGRLAALAGLGAAALVRRLRSR